MVTLRIDDHWQAQLNKNKKKKVSQVWRSICQNVELSDTPIFAKEQVYGSKSAQKLNVRHNTYIVTQLE